MPVKYTEEKLEQIVSDYQNSKMTKVEWCRSKGMSENSLQYCLKKRASQNNQVEWAEVPIEDIKETYPSLKLKLGKLELEINSGFDKRLLKDILEVVMRI